MLTGDSIGEAVIWEDGTEVIKDSKQVLHARLHMQSAQVWAFELRPPAQDHKLRHRSDRERREESR